MGTVDSGAGESYPHYPPATSNDRLQRLSNLQQGYGRPSQQRRHINPAHLKQSLPPA